MSLFGGRRSGFDDDAPETGAAGARAASAGIPSGGGQRVACIGKSISIVGDLTGNEDITIDGVLEGAVELPDSQLTVGGSGQLRGRASARCVVVIGRVAGNVEGSERVEIQASGVVEGDVYAPRLAVAEGAVVNGTIKMTREGTEAPAQPEAASAPGDEPS